MPDTHDILSLWRSPLDAVAIAQAQALSDCQPRCSTIGYGEDFSAMTIYNFGNYVEGYPSSYNDAIADAPGHGRIMATAPAGQYGLAIATGSNIKILGGTYTSNGPSGGAGIAITGAATEVQIIGVNLQPSSAVPSSPNAQQYALLISGNPAGVLVSSCDMTGYGSASPVRITGFPATLRITGCPVYNNSNTNLTASPTQLITGVNAASSTTPYYGPSVFMYSNPTTLTLHVFGQSIVASTGIFFLPSAYDTFFFNSAPASFTWIGQ